MLEHERQHYILKEDFFIQSNSFPVNAKSEDIPINVTSERRFDPQSSESYLSYEVEYTLIPSTTRFLSIHRFIAPIFPPTRHGMLSGTSARTLLKMVRHRC